MTKGATATKRKRGKRVTSESRNRAAGVLAAESQALELRLGGASYRQIGTELGVSHETARRHVDNALQTILHEPSEQVRQMEVARLDKMLMAVWKKVTDGDIEAGNYALRIMDRRARMLGLDAPRKVDITAWVREMALREGLDPKQAVADAEAILKEVGA